MTSDPSRQHADRTAFEALSEPHRRELRVHCYRLVGSFSEAEDLVQETMLRAWRGFPEFEARSSVRAWLYRIATNVCLSALERSSRRVLPQDVAAPVTADTPASQARPAPDWAPEFPWLEPCPDDLLNVSAPNGEADALLSSRESVALVFLAALQHLPPRQRAAFVLAEVLGWSAAEVAALLETTVPAVNSALQRAHETMRSRLPDHGDWRRATVSREEHDALQLFMAAWQRSDTAELLRLLREDARWAMPPAPLWFDGRAAIARLLTLFPPNWQGRTFQLVPLAGNRQLAAAAYMRAADAPEFRLVALHLFRFERAEIAEITTFSPELCGAFQLPVTWTDEFSAGPGLHD